MEGLEDRPGSVETILNISLQLVANPAIAFEPFLLFSSEKLRKMLNIETFDWNQLGDTDILKAGHQLAEPETALRKTGRRGHRQAVAETRRHQKGERSRQLQV